jgi:hypothetical protein
MTKRDARLVKVLQTLVAEGCDGEKQAASLALRRILSKKYLAGNREKTKPNQVMLKYVDTSHKEILIGCILKITPTANLEQTKVGKYIVADLTPQETESVKALASYYWKCFQREVSMLLAAFVIKNDLIGDSDADMQEEDVANISGIVDYFNLLKPVLKQLKK